MMLFSFMCVYAAASAVEVVTMKASDQFKIYKCCKKGEILDSHMRTCKQLAVSPENVNKTYQVQRSSKRELQEHVSPGAPDDLVNIRVGDLGVGVDGRWSAEFLGVARKPSCSERQTLRLTSGSTGRFKWLKNGSLVLYSPTAKGRNITNTFTPEELCVNNVEDSDKIYAILVCPCQKINCVNKCCSSGYMKKCSNFNCTCQESETIWKPFHEDNQLPPDKDISYEILEANEPVCSEGKSIWIDNPLFKPHHYKRYWWEYPEGYLFSDSNVCGDFVVFDNHPKYQTIGYCYRNFLFDDMFSAGAWFRVVPTTLLAITLVVLILVPERRLSIRGWVHSKALLCHTSTLLLSNALLVAYVIVNDDVVYCRTTPFIIYFSLVAAAFWLNAICINMAWGFGRPQGPHDDEPGAKRRVFLCYSLYAWGASLSMTAIAATMWYVRDIPENFLRPTLMETRSCFWEDEKGAGKMGTLAYFYGPVGALLIVNASLFLFIAVRVKHLKRRTSILTRETSSRFQSQRHALLYVRIVWLMGVAEMAVETTAWALHGEGYYFHLAAELIDFLRVVSIFVLCVCKRRTMRALRQRLCACSTVDGVREPASSGQPRSQQNKMQLSESASQEPEANQRPTSLTSVETVSTICEGVPT